MSTGLSASYSFRSIRAPTTLPTPGTFPMAAMSASSIVLLTMSSVFFWEIVKSALPTWRIWVAVSFRLAVRTPSAVTAITPIATAAAVSVAAQRTSRDVVPDEPDESHAAPGPLTNSLSTLTRTHHDRALRA